MRETPIISYLHQVPYFKQTDSRTWQHDRMCQSSAIAMVLNYMYAGTDDDPTFKGKDKWDDDDYLEYMNKFGDTVMADSHKRALVSLDVDAEFKTNGRVEDITDLLSQGIPVPIGILHYGKLEDPSGYGHWVVVIGHTKHYYIVHDPWGELNLNEGGFYQKYSGECILYRKEKLEKRWLIDREDDGWYWDFSRTYNK